MAIEFGLVALPVIWFIFGIVQTAWIVWINNMLHISVDVASRCGAVGSATLPCTTSAGGTLANMKSAANLVFGMTGGVSPPTWSANGNCSASEIGLVGSYRVNIVSVVNLTLTARSCYAQP